MAKGKGSHRARKARKEWTKRGKGRPEHDVDPHGDTRAGTESMRPKGVRFDDAGEVDHLPVGRVVRSQSGLYSVQVSETDPIVDCRIKRGASTENPDSTLVVIGDRVRFNPIGEGEGLIVHVEERTSDLGREGTGRSKGGRHVIAANVDQALCVLSAERGDLRHALLDRYIVGALLGNVEPVIILNKVDALSPEESDRAAASLDLYRNLGYRVLTMSALESEGIEPLRGICRDKTSVLVGQSGVGKSTIANVLLGEERRETGAVRERDRRGKHTTVGSEILALPSGGQLIDTPGLREFGIHDLEPEELDGYFVEFLDYLQECKYLPCTHTHEPECAVREAVEQGTIAPDRYESYLSIFRSLQ